MRPQSIGDILLLMRSLYFTMANNLLPRLVRIIEGHLCYQGYLKRHP